MRSLTSTPLVRCSTSPAHGPVALADLVHEARAARLGQELAAIADQPAHGDDRLQAHAAVGVAGHLLDARLAGRQRGGDGADVLGRDVDA